MKSKIPTTIEDFAATKNYLTTSLYSFGFPISEYDISKANINILRSYQKISEFDYNKLFILPKIDREIEIGKRIQTDWEVQEIISKGIEAAKFQFLKQNNINLNNIFRIANDAFYLIGNNNIQNTIIIPDGGITPIEFKHKRTYNFYMNLNKILVFIDNAHSDWDIEVIGINSDNYKLHQDFLQFLCILSDRLLLGGKETALRYLYEIHQKYTTNQLDIGFYREFNSVGCFKYYNGSNEYLSIIPINGNDNYLDKSYNLEIIRTIYSYIMAS